MDIRDFQNNSATPTPPPAQDDHNSAPIPNSPSSPEGTIYLTPESGQEFHTEIPLENIEESPENSPEIYKAPEIPVPQPIQPEENSNQSTTTIPVVSEPQLPVKNIVDNRTNHEELHHIKETVDKLTVEADAEEEHFIEEIEKHHEHQ